MSDARTVLASVPLHRFRFGENDVYLSQASIDAILAALADAGLVIVPREPTPALCFKVLAALPSDWDGFQAEDIKELWRAALEAANEQ